MTAERFEELYERYVDGALSAAEREEFIGLLGNAAFRARFVELSAYETAIGEEIGLTVRESRSDPKPSSKRLAPVRRLPRRASPPAPAWRIGAGIAAAGIVGIIIVIATASGGRAPRRPAPPVAGTTPAVEPRPAQPSSQPREQIVPPRRPEPPRLEEPLQPRAPEPLVLPEPKKEPVPPKGPEPPAERREPSTRPEPAAPKESSTFIANVERASGDASVGNEPAGAGKGIVSGMRLATGTGGYLLVKFQDGTRIELGTDTILPRIAEGAAGKWVQVERGLVGVEAAKQAAGRPLVLATPFAEATVLGTEFTLWTTATFARLDVKEGRVKFTRLPGVTSLAVGAGHYAIAGAGFDFAARPLPSLWKAPAAGLILWLRAESVLNPSQWPDLSPAGNHGTQPAAASQPVFIANAAGTRPALRFDGKSQFYSLPDGFADFKSGLSAFVVARPAAGGAWSRFIDLDTGPACDNIVFGRKDAPDKLGFWVYSNNQTRGKVEAPGAVVADQLQSFGVVLAGQGRATLYRNGAAVATGQTSVPVAVNRKPNAIAKSNTGGDPYYKGDLFEILLFNRALADTERAYVDGYLNTKYFDATSPPPMNRPAEK